MTGISQLWDLIEAKGFREDNNADDNNDKDLIETWGFREDIKDDEVEDNDKDDDNNGNDISALELYRDLVFSRVPSCGTPMTKSDLLIFGPLKPVRSKFTSRVNFRRRTTRI